MGLLSQPADRDPRCVVDAYVCRGASLYRVHRKTPSGIVLEDAYQSHGDEQVLKQTTAATIVGNYELVKEAE